MSAQPSIASRYMPSLTNSCGPARCSRIMSARAAAPAGIGHCQSVGHGDGGVLALVLCRLLMRASALTVTVLVTVLRAICGCAASGAVSGFSGMGSGGRDGGERAARRAEPLDHANDGRHLWCALGEERR